MSIYRYTEIRLSIPICSCKKQDLSWNPFLEETGTSINEKGETIRNFKVGLNITCNQCKVSLTIPSSQFKAKITLDTPYPEEKKEEPASVSKEEKLKN